MARGASRQKLTSLSDIYGYFRNNHTPITFLSPTPYNILGLGRWINRFEYINFFRLLRRHPSQSHGAARAWAARIPLDRGRQQLPAPAQGSARPPRPSAARPPAARHVRRGDRSARQGARAEDRAAAGETAQAYRFQDRHHPARQRGGHQERAQYARPGKDLRRTAEARARRRSSASDLVVQTPYGDSGRTTFFIKSEADWKKNAEDAGQGAAQGHAADQSPARHASRRWRPGMEPSSARCRPTSPASPK